MARRYEEEAGSFGFGSSGSRPAQGSSKQNDVAKDLQDIAGMNRRATSMIGKIGGASDSASLRKQIHELQTLFTRSVKSAKTTITQQVKSTDATVKLQGNRCLQALQGEVSTFEESLKELRSKEQRFPASKFASSTDGRGDFNFAMDDDSGSGGGGGRATTDRFAVAQQEELQNTEKRQQEHEALKNLEGDMQDLHSMFVDMAALVNDQGEVVNSIEDNVVSAEIKVEQASNDVRQAAQYQSKARRKKVCCLIIVGAAVVAIVIIVVVVVVTKNN